MVDFTKPVHTKSGGNRVTLIAQTDRHLWVDIDGCDGPLTYQKDFADSTFVNVPEPVVQFVNVYHAKPNECSWVSHPSLERAKECARQSCLATVKLTYLPGNATVEIVEEYK